MSTIKLIIDIPKYLYDAIMTDKFGIFNNAPCDVIRNGTSLPIGEWITIKNSDGNLKCYKCSNCGKYQGYISNYCEDCGVKMKGDTK